MLAQISAILIPPAGVDTKAFEKFLLEDALPAAERLTRITREVLQGISKGEDQVGGRTYYLWRAAADLMTNSEEAVSEYVEEMYQAIRHQLSTQNATITSPLTVLTKQP